MRKARARIQGWKINSPTVRELSKKTGFLRLRSPERSTFIGKPTDLIFNWGSSQGRFCGPKIFNLPHRVLLAVDKTKSFRMFQDFSVPTVPFTTEIENAFEWMEESGVVARFLSSSFGGQGAHYIPAGTDLVDWVEEHGVPMFWSKYVPKFDEYRVHIWGDEVMDVQQKKLKKGNEPHRIRAHSNGYVFARQDIAPPDSVLEAALLAVKVLELDFGAVDVGYTRNTERAAVYEVNTAPGLTGTTLDLYVNKMKQEYEQFKEEVQDGRS